MPSVFISYSRSNKGFVDRLVRDLSKAGIEFWIDDHGLNVGESLIEKISKAIASNDFFAVIISKVALSSEWVKKELSLALMKELSSKKVVVLPLLIEECDLPVTIKDKKYADFRRSYNQGLKQLFRALGIPYQIAYKSPVLENKVASVKLPLTCRALVIDSEETWGNVLKRLLENTGLSVTIARSYEEAVNLIRRQFFHLLISEIHLKLDDWETKEGFRILEISRELEEGTQVILITGYGTMEDGVEAMSKGAFHLQDKASFSSREFQEYAKKAIERASEALRQREIGLEQLFQNYHNDTYKNIVWIDRFLRNTRLNYLEADSFILDLLKDISPLLPLASPEKLIEFERNTTRIRTMCYWSKMLAMPVYIKIGESSLIQDELGRERYVVLRMLTKRSIVGVVCPALGFDFQDFRATTKQPVV